MPIPGLPFTDAELFPAINVVLPAWILLYIGPKWRLTQAYVFLATAAMCLLYALLIYNSMSNPESGFSLQDMSSWEGVARLLSMQSTVLPAWVHYVAFDLWTGRWIALDAAERGVPRLLLGPILVLTLMLGPCGLLPYLAIQGFWSVKQVPLGVKAKAA